jgi:inosose dehydratase
LVEPAQLEPAQWNDLVTGLNRLGRALLEEFGVSLVFHPHVDTHVATEEEIGRLCDDTDPALVNLCLDTGHIAYAGGDNVAIVRRDPDRIRYVHLKQYDPAVVERVNRERLPFSDAVKLGAMVEPPHGEPDMPPLLDALAALDRDLFCIIEQDLYPVEPDVPMPIAARTAGYFAACGLGPTRRWPYQNQPT